MFLCFCIIVLFSVLIQDTESNGYSDPLPAVIEDHPYQVYLEGDCGGSIISPRFILTAAHCVEEKSLLKVRAGSTYSNYGGSIYNSTRIIKHPRFKLTNVDYDVAIIVLQTDMFLDGLTTREVELPPMRSSVQPGTKVIVAGWGRNIIGAPMSTIQLMAIEVQTISNKECQRLQSRRGLSVTSRMFCTLFRQGGIDACQGDSGGPAVDSETGVQIGVVSWGGNICAYPEPPGVYADLTNSEIRHWIHLITGV